VYELHIADTEDMGLCALCVESYVLGRQAGFALLQKDYGNDWDEMGANIQADVDHHEASPWH
jgi:glycine cleavage system aminomethyltransferase T